MKEIPNSTGCHVATHPKSWSCESRRICLFVFLLFVLETSQYPSGLCLEEVALLVSLDGEHPSSSHIVLRFDLPHVNEIKNLIVKPGFVLKMFRFSKLFVVSSYFLSCCFFSCTRSHLGPYCSYFSTGGHAFQHVSDLTVNSVLRNFNLCAAGSSVTSSRHNDRCTHGNSSQVVDILLFSVFRSHKTK